MSKIIEKPENYLKHRVQTYGSKAYLIVDTEDNSKPEKIYIGDSFSNYEVEVLDDELVITETA